MKTLNHKLLALAIAGAAGTASISAMATDPFTEALTTGKASGDINIRYEDVESGDTDSDQLSIRTRIGYTTGSISGFSAMVEFEDTRDLLGIDDENGLVPDNENTEVDQAFIQYKNDLITAKVGRQVITLDDHRQVGHVGWRQDRQTFDGTRVMIKPTKELSLDLSYITKVNRINSGDGGFPDVTDASHKLVNASYQTSFGKAVAYAYDLSEEAGGPGFDATETFGGSFKGSADVSDSLKVLYGFEYATQDNETDDADTEFTFVELGASFAGFTVKYTAEVIGSDENSSGGYTTFSFPYSTAHKFNGWADVWLGGQIFGRITNSPVGAPTGDAFAGLEDNYLTIATKKFAGVNLVAKYHEYDSEEGGFDLGNEFNFLATKKFTKNYSAGFKYADYSAGDVGVDKSIVWVWVNAKF